MRNCRVCALTAFCPVNVLTRHKLCSAPSLLRKPLSLLSKPALSTTRPAFTITTSFIYLFKLTNTGNAYARGQTRLARAKTVKTRTDGKAFGLPAFFVYRKNVMRTHRREAGRGCAYGPACKTGQPFTEKQRKTAGIRLDCGKTPAYPQDRMCRTGLFWLTPLFFQLTSCSDTMFFQQIRSTVNH